MMLKMIMITPMILIMMMIKTRTYDYLEFLREKNLSTF